MSNQIFKHRSDGYIFLSLHYDKRVFGVYRAVHEMRKINTNNVRIHDDEVQVKFRSKWTNVEEYNEKGHTRVRDLIREMAVEAGKPYYAVVAAVQFS